MKNFKIAVVGLGYVGLPLAIEFAKKYEVIGFDINSKRVNELKNGIDSTLEAELDSLNLVIKSSSDECGLVFSTNAAEIAGCNIYIVTVPTPINEFKSPDLSYLLNASET